MKESAAPLRVQCVGRRAFPRFLPASEFARDIKFVSSRPDVIILEHIGPPASSRTKIDLSPSFAALTAGRPTAIFHTLDAWDWPTEWDEQARRLTGAATVVFGTQLPPNRIGGARVVPLLCPPSIGAPTQRVTVHYDLIFFGWFFPQRRTLERPPGLPQEAWNDPREGWRDPSAPHKARWLQNLRERGIAVALLEQALRGYRLRIENGAFWFATDRERERMNRAYRDALTRTRVVFAPPGRGCSTQRLTDAWMHECVVLSPDLAERIRVPQPRLWVNEAHYVRYSWSLDDLVERAKFAIERADDLSDRARVGREYAERWGAPDRQMATVVRSLREIA